MTLLTSGKMEAGEHEVVFNASDIPSGIYFYHLKANEFKQVKKFLLLK